MAHFRFSKSLNCHCEAFHCLGPNVLKNMYYPNTDFKQKEIEMHTENILVKHQ